jgi:teichuronic acid biosynthesis glycosyltransferase TuaC
MACNCPIVSTDVGDVREIVGNTPGCFITAYNPNDVADKIRLALTFETGTSGRAAIGQYDNRIIAAKVMEVYRKVLMI